MASASLVLQLGLLNLRPLQYWLKPRVPPHAWHHGRLCVKVNQACVAALAPWKNHQWMEQGVPLGKLNLGADMLSRSNEPSDEWTLHPQMVQEIWGIFVRPEVDRFTSEDGTHCQTYFSKDRDALAHDWPNLLLFALNSWNQGTATYLKCSRLRSERRW